MKAYLVRHAESEYNALGIHSDADTPLSERGRHEASALATRLAASDASLIVSSPYPRALETASIIAQALQTPILESSLVVELKRPSEIEGLWRDDPSVISIRAGIVDQWEDPSWHHSDEENFFDLRSRALEALDFLAGCSYHTSIVVVTHAVFMRMLVCVMALGSNLGPSTFKRMVTFLGSNNAGVTECELQASGWRLCTWNDHTHVGNATVWVSNY